jgi:Domain of unknown function (DUF4342)
MPDQNARTEEFTIHGEAVVAKIKELVHEGNIRRITIKDESGQTLIEIPLTLGVVGAVLMPVWAAIGAIAALAVKLTIVIERVDEGPTPKPKDDQNNSTLS